jgi:AcrR family transcriptional regulator
MKKTIQRRRTAKEPCEKKGCGRPLDEEASRRILHAAVELLDEQGFHQVTSEAIAQRAGVSKATIYRRWPDKASLLIEAFREAVAPQIAYADTDSLRDDLRQQLRDFTKMLMGQPGRVFKAFVAAAQKDPEVADAFRTFWIKPRRMQAKKLLIRKQEKGQLRADLDLDAVLDMLYGPIYFRLLRGHAPISTKYAETIADTALDGLRP